MTTYATRTRDDVIIAGVTLLNDTLEDISASKKSDAEVIAVELAVSMSSKVLFLI